MANPFPGIDPYVEDQDYWRDFQTSFLTYMSDMLNDRLPDGYDTELRERFTIGSSNDDVDLRGDVIVSREEDVERWLEVRRREDRSVVAVIELLSPTNKLGKGWDAYVARRELLIDEPVHLIELDFLLGGRRLPMGRPLPAGDFYAFVSRADRRPDSEVYAWSIRGPLPTIPIPLDSPTPDVRLDLAPLYATAHERGRYGRKVRRDRPLGVPLGTDDLGWAAALVAGA